MTAKTPAPARANRGPIAVTMGEPAGIGGELVLMAWRILAARAQTDDGTPVFFVLDDPDRLTTLARTARIETPITVIETPEGAAEAFARALPVLPLPLVAPVRPGVPDPANAPVVLAAIERAVELATAGRAVAIVTNPVHKKTLYEAGFAHPGHTEYLAALAGITTPPVMMLTCPGLRVVPVTVHLALAAAIRALSHEAIVHAGRVTAAALRRDFALARPRLAVAGLNPHAGEGGALGDEEARIIVPAIRTLRDEGIAADGPHPADTMFHDDARRDYDAALCMYHDQALIPLKTLDFHNGVNITLGLPFVRTSPDHGTAFAIAGTGKANPASLVAALETAAAMAAARAAAQAAPTAGASSSRA